MLRRSWQSKVGEAGLMVRGFCPIIAGCVVFWEGQSFSMDVPLLLSLAIQVGMWRWQ